MTPVEAFSAAQDGRLPALMVHVYPVPVPPVAASSSAVGRARPWRPGGSSW